MNILIYGGSFDPVHKGHYALLKSAIKQLAADKIYIFTAYQSPFKQKSKTSFELRQKMAREALGNLSQNIIFDDYEQKAGRITYTCETLAYVRKLYPDARIYLLVGADCLNDLPRWKNSDYIFRNSIIAAGKRKGVDFQTKDFEYVLLKGSFPRVSSTQLRIAMLCNGLVPTSLCPETETRIERDKMYGMDIHSWLQNNLKPNRYLHVKMVAQAAVELANIYNANPEQMALAAILHDAAKCMSSLELVRYAADNKIQVRDFDDVCKFSPSLLHAEVSAHIAKNVFGINDENVLNAIKNHTLGRLNMSLEEKIIFISDMASKDRRRRDSNFVHQASLKSLDEGMFAAMVVKLLFTIETGKWLAPRGIELWNEIISKRK